MKLKDKIFLITLCSLVVIALIIMGVGYQVAGANVLAWFSSIWARWIYLAIGIFVLVYVSLKIYDRIKRL
ncbi:MAG: hypothetical protein M0R51_14785 [Clostridia bacterium]|jgi:uncharacterized membrane protein|nr:hypothetical protein [Clostridia bacterium]